jgi:hypothetical protein
MKKALTILISVVFIASSLHVSIDRHFCQGSLFATKISFSREKASCGMEQADSPNTGNLIFDSKCCEDVMSSFTLNNNFFPEYFQVNKPYPVKQVMIFQNVVLPENSFFNIAIASFSSPPGENINFRHTLPDFCVFRI